MKNVKFWRNDSILYFQLFIGVLGFLPTFQKMTLEGGGGGGSLHKIAVTPVQGNLCPKTCTEHLKREKSKVTKFELLGVLSLSEML